MAPWQRLLMVMVVVGGTVGVASADNLRRAREYYAAGQQKFYQGDFQAAIQAFRAADRVVPSPILEFNIALSYERVGNTTKALEGYRRYLKRYPAAPNRVAVEAAITRLKKRARLPPKTQELGLLGSDYPDESLHQGQSAQINSRHGMKRIAEVDVAAIRDRRGFRGVVEPSGQDQHAHPVPKDDKTSARKPFYKKWWFWVIAGVGTVVVVTAATSDSSSSRNTSAASSPGLSVSF